MGIIEEIDLDRYAFYNENILQNILKFLYH